MFALPALHSILCSMWTLDLKDSGLTSHMTIMSRPWTSARNRVQGCRSVNPCSRMLSRRWTRLWKHYRAPRDHVPCPHIRCLQFRVPEHVAMRAGRGKELPKIELRSFRSCPFLKSLGVGLVFIRLVPHNFHCKEIDRLIFAWPRDYPVLTKLGAINSRIRPLGDV